MKLQESHDTGTRKFNKRTDSGKVFKAKGIENLYYLEATVTNKNDERTEVSTRVIKGNRSAGALYDFLS